MPNYVNGKICYIGIPAVDVDESAAFYTAVFGWVTRRRPNGELTFNDGAGEVSGMWITGRQPSAATGLLMYIMVDDIEATIAAVLTRRCEIVQAVDADALETTAQFRDPAGNVLGLYQQPGR